MMMFILTFLHDVREGGLHCVWWDGPLTAEIRSDQSQKDGDEDISYEDEDEDVNDEMHRCQTNMSALRGLHFHQFCT